MIYSIDLFDLSTSALSSSHAESTDFLESLSPSVPIGHHTRLVLETVSGDLAELTRVSLISRPILVYPWIGVHWWTFLMSSFLLFQRCPPCLTHLSWEGCEIGGKWSYSCCFVEHNFQDFKTARIIVVTPPFIFFYKPFFKVLVVQLYNSTVTSTTWQNSHFI